jgi:hypothetical protein
MRSLFFNTVECLWIVVVKQFILVGRSVQNYTLIPNPLSLLGAFPQTYRELYNRLMDSYFGHLTPLNSRLYTSSTKPTITTKLIYIRMF